MRAWAAVIVAVLGGCTSVRVVQRDGCWVRRTSSFFGGTREEVGPCARPPPAWSDDRVTRLVQECVARADYQWQTRALAAFNRGETLPRQSPEEKVLQDCMGESSRVMAEENATLKARLAETAAERDALRVRSDEERTHLRSALDKVSEQLGEAARKPLPPAVATATASSEGRGDATSPASTPSPVHVVGAPAPAPERTVAAEPVVRAPPPEPVRLERAGPARPPAVCAPEPAGTRRTGKKADRAACEPPPAEQR